MKIEFARRLANLWEIYTKVKKCDKILAKWRKLMEKQTKKKF